MSRSEKAILNDVLVAASSLPDSLIWRNNTGQAWQGAMAQARIGDTITVEPGMVILRNARPIDFGLKGSGDAIGAIQGRPVAIETKTLLGRQSEQQGNFDAAWVRAGGLYVLGRTADEVMTQLLLNL